MKITQRTAILSDAVLLHSWRNDSRVRGYAVHSDLTPLDEHLVWFSARLERVKLEPFFFFAVGSKLVGMSRLGVVSDALDKYEISILVDPNHVGKGIGTRILRMTCASFFGLYPEKTILARVRENNLPSQKLFVSAGFLKLYQVGNLLHYEKTLN